MRIIEKKTVNSSDIESLYGSNCKVAIFFKTIHPLIVKLNFGIQPVFVICIPVRSLLHHLSTTCPTLIDWEIDRENLTRMKMVTFIRWL